jgi:HlyD family secretion protein
VPSIFSLALVLLVSYGAARAADPVDPSADVIVLRRCLVDYEKTATLASMLNGVLKECLVEPGDRVKAGQVIGRLRDEDVRAELKLRETEAGSDIEIRVGMAKKAQADHKARRTASLVRRDAAPAEEYTLHRMEAELAALETEQAKHRHSLSQIQLELARAHLREREFTSPHDGTVIQVLKRPGETVAPRDPVFRVVDVDNLLVTGMADVTDAWRLRIGQPVRIVPDVGGAELAIEREVFSGRIAFVDTHVDPTTLTCKVTAKIGNRRGMLRAGLEARMEISPEPARSETAVSRKPLAGPPAQAPARRPTALTGGAP